MRFRRRKERLLTVLERLLSVVRRCRKAGHERQWPGRRRTRVLRRCPIQQGHGRRRPREPHLLSPARRTCGRRWPGCSRRPPAPPPARQAPRGRPGASQRSLPQRARRVRCLPPLTAHHPPRARRRARRRQRAPTPRRPSPPLAGSAARRLTRRAPSLSRPCRRAPLAPAASALPAASRARHPGSARRPALGGGQWRRAARAPRRGHPRGPGCTRGRGRCCCMTWRGHPVRGGPRPPPRNVLAGTAAGAQRAFAQPPPRARPRTRPRDRGLVP
jgi:hypothetical protein